MFKHLTLRERKDIEFLISHNFSIPDIAKRLDRHYKTISQEIERCGDIKNYSAIEAQKQHDNLKSQASKKNLANLNNLMARVEKLENDFKLFIENKNDN